VIPADRGRAAKSKNDKMAIVKFLSIIKIALPVSASGAAGIGTDIYWAGR
jgi:hypothetical protein